MHPRIALYNASKNLELNDVEKDMIENHMFPLAFEKPQYIETLVILTVDKICALKEAFQRRTVKKLNQKISLKP